MENSTEEQLTLFAEDSLAKTYPLQEAKAVLPQSAVACGLSCAELLAKYDPSTQSWKMFQTSLLDNGELGLAEFSETWPRSGMTRNGIAYQLPTLADLTSEIGSGLLPTLGKNEGKGASRNRYKGSSHYRGAKMAEGLRAGESDPIYTHPDFAEWAMGFPIGWTEQPAAETQ